MTEGRRRKVEGEEGRNPTLYWFNKSDINVYGVYMQNIYFEDAKSFI